MNEMNEAVRNSERAESHRVGTMMNFDFTSLQRHRGKQGRQLMEEHGLDALVLSRNDTFQFFSNVEMGAHYWERPFALVIPSDGKPIALVNQVSENGMRMQKERGSAWFDRIHVYCEMPRMVGRRYSTGEFATLLTDVLEDVGLSNARIGVDTLTPDVSEASEELPGLRVQPLQGALFMLRQVKHPVEIELMRGAAGLGDYAMERLKDALRPGADLQSVSSSVIADVMAEGGRRFPGGNLQVLKMLTLCGPASASTDGDGAPTGTVVRPAEPIVSVIVPRLNGYSVEVHRTYFSGRPSSEYQSLFNTALEINKAALAQVYAGNPVTRIDEAVHEVAYAAGHYEYLSHRAGHGIGVTTHELPADVPFNQRQIMEGEVYSCEPGLYVYGKGGFRIGDVVVARGRPEILTAAPKNFEDCLID